MSELWSLVRTQRAMLILKVLTGGGASIFGSEFGGKNWEVVKRVLAEELRCLIVEEVGIAHEVGSIHEEES